MYAIEDHDKACDDLHRLFYKHRRPHGVGDEAVRILGKGITYRELKASTAKLEGGKRGPHAAQARQARHTVARNDPA